MKVSPIRIQDVRVEYDMADVYVLASLLDRTSPTGYLFWIEHTFVVQLGLRTSLSTLPSWPLHYNLYIFLIILFSAFLHVNQKEVYESTMHSIQNVY